MTHTNLPKIHAKFRKHGASANLYNPAKHTTTAVVAIVTSNKFELFSIEFVGQLTLGQTAGLNCRLNVEKIYERPACKSKNEEKIADYEYDIECQIRYAIENITEDMRDDDDVEAVNL